MFRFFDTVKTQDENETVTEKIYFRWKEMSENTNDTEVEFASVEELLNIHRSESNKTTLVSEIPNIINKVNVIIAPGQGKIPVSILTH